MKQEEKQKHYERAQVLLSEQRFTLALIVGFFTMIVAAAAYGLIAMKWDFSSGFAAIGIGIALGFSMQLSGKGLTPRFMIAAGALTVIGCMLGTAITTVLQRRYVSGESIPHAMMLDVSDALLSQSVFWLIGVFFAVFLAKRSLSRADRLALRTYELRA